MTKLWEYETLDLSKKFIHLEDYPDIYLDQNLVFELKDTMTFKNNNVEEFTYFVLENDENKLTFKIGKDDSYEILDQNDNKIIHINDSFSPIYFHKNINIANTYRIENNDQNIIPLSNGEYIVKKYYQSGIDALENELNLLDFTKKLEELTDFPNFLITDYIEFNCNNNFEINSPNLILQTLLNKLHINISVNGIQFDDNNGKILNFLNEFDFFKNINIKTGNKILIEDYNPSINDNDVVEKKYLDERLIGFTTVTDLENLSSYPTFNVENLEFVTNSFTIKNNDTVYFDLNNEQAKMRIEINSDGSFRMKSQNDSIIFLMTNMNTGSFDFYKNVYLSNTRLYNSVLNLTPLVENEYVTKYYVDQEINSFQEEQFSIPENSIEPTKLKFLNEFSNVGFWFVQIENGYLVEYKAGIQSLTGFPIIETDNYPLITFQNSQSDSFEIMIDNKKQITGSKESCLSLQHYNYNGNIEETSKFYAECDNNGYEELFFEMSQIGTVFEINANENFLIDSSNIVKDSGLKFENSIYARNFIIENYENYNANSNCAVSKWYCDETYEPKGASMNDNSISFFKLERWQPSYNPSQHDLIYYYGNGEIGSYKLQQPMIDSTNPLFKNGQSFYDYNGEMKFEFDIGPKEFGYCSKYAPYNDECYFLNYNYYSSQYCSLDISWDRYLMIYTSSIFTSNDIISFWAGSSKEWYINSSGNHYQYCDREKKNNIINKSDYIKNKKKNYLDRILKTNIYSYTYKKQENDLNEHEKNLNGHFQNKIQLGVMFDEIENLYNGNVISKKKYVNNEKCEDPKKCVDCMSNKHHDKKNKKKYDKKHVNYEELFLYNILAFEEHHEDEFLPLKEELIEEQNQLTHFKNIIQEQNDIIEKLENQMSALQNKMNLFD